MKCHLCGLMSTVRDISALRAYTDELRQVNRTRKCRNGHTWRTAELDMADVSELRRKAHLYEMSRAKEAA